MSEITFDVDPLALRDLNMLPSSVQIIGSREAYGYVRFVAQSLHLSSGHYSIRVIVSPTSRTIEIIPQDEEAGAAA